MQGKHVEPLDSSIGNDTNECLKDRLGGMFLFGQILSQEAHDRHHGSCIAIVIHYICILFIYLSIYRSIDRSIYFMFFQAATFRKNHCLTETVWIDVNLLLQLRCLACERQLFRQGLLISWREITSWSISKISKAWEGRNKVGTTDNNCSASLTESTSSFQILMISSKTEMWNCRSGSLADTTNHSHRTPPT